MFFYHRLLSILRRYLSPVCRPIQSVAAAIEYRLLDIWWALKGFRKPSADDAAFVRENVTFMFKSFERQRQARALVRSISQFYPETRIVIADDSSKPLEIPGRAGDDKRDAGDDKGLAGDDKLKIIQMPFNLGLSRGLNLALAEVKTPFLMRMDDDELLTRRVNLAEELRFFQSHPEVDLIGIPPMDALKFRSLKKSIRPYFGFPMKEAPLPLKVPHGVRLDDRHVVLGKVPNIFLARTDSIRKVGWDDNIRMIDHHDFFYRAAGVIVSVLSTDSVVFHNHNFFLPDYNRYRSDWKGDAMYLHRVRYGRKNH